METSKASSASVGLYVGLRNHAGSAVLPLQERGTHNAEGEPQGMVGALQPLAHVKLTTDEFNALRGPGIKDGDYDALQRGLPKEVGSAAAAVILDVLSAAWEASDNRLQQVGEQINGQGRRVRTLLLDLRDECPELARTHTHIPDACLSAEQFTQLVASHVNPAGEVSGFLLWAGAPALEDLQAPERDKVNKGKRVIADGSLRMFPDDREAAERALSLLNRD